MEFDQLLFKKFMNFYDRRIRRRSQVDHTNGIALEEIASRLTLLARACTGCNIEIMPAEEEGGWKNNQFYLPTSFALLPQLSQNLNFYLFRVVYLSIQFEARLNWSDKVNEITITAARDKASEIAPHILGLIKQDYPPVHLYFERIRSQFGSELQPEYWLFGKYMRGTGISQDHVDLTYDQNIIGRESVDAETEIKSKAVEEAEVISVDKKAQDDYVMTHNFEKVETAEEFSGIWRGFDGDDTLEEDADALKELNLKYLVRTDEQAKSIYQADFRDLTHIPESKEAPNIDQPHKLYDEWNFIKNRYKIDHCRVYEREVVGNDNDYATQCLEENQKTLNGLRRKFAQINQQRQLVKKLPHGEQIDIDALVGWYSDISAGRTPSENIYIAKRKKTSDLSISFLLDLSLSTDSYADGQRVLDVEKQAVILFGEVLHEYDVQFSIGGFYSKTRNHCVYVPIKRTHENWSRAKHNLGILEPEGYTRIGPALRHAKSLIEKNEATHKWIILLSDGKPNDYDQYEGKYGIADVKQALREMHARHINTYAIAIESIARYYLPQMFGQNHYNILSHPDMLIPSLAKLYRRIQNH